MARKTYTKRISSDGGEGLSPREAAFLKHYLADPNRNGTQAAIKAGYAPGSAKVTASRLLTRDNVSSRVAAADQKVAASVERATDRFAISKERIMAELARMAFSDIRNVLTFGPEHRKLTLMDGSVLKTSGVGIIASDELSDDAAAAIEEVSEGPNGIKVKLASKRAALIDLAKMAGFYVEKPTLDPDSVAVTLAAIVAGIQRSALPLTGANIITAGVTLDAQVVDADEVPDP